MNGWRNREGIDMYETFTTLDEGSQAGMAIETRDGSRLSVTMPVDGHRLQGPCVPDYYRAELRMLMAAKLEHG